MSIKNHVIALCCLALGIVLGYFAPHKQPASAPTAGQPAFTPPVAPPDDKNKPAVLPPRPPEKVQPPPEVPAEMPAAGEVQRPPAQPAISADEQRKNELLAQARKLKEQSDLQAKLDQAAVRAKSAYDYWQNIKNLSSIDDILKYLNKAKDSRQLHGLGGKDVIVLPNCISNEDWARLNQKNITKDEVIIHAELNYLEAKKNLETLQKQAEPAPQPAP